MKTVLTGFANGPNVGGEGKRGDKNDSRASGLSNSEHETATETEATVGGNPRNLGLDVLGLCYLFDIHVEESSWTQRPGAQRRALGWKGGLGEVSPWLVCADKNGLTSPRKVLQTDKRREPSTEPRGTGTAVGQEGEEEPAVNAEKSGRREGQGELFQGVAVTCFCK